MYDSKKWVLATLLFLLLAQVIAENAIMGPLVTNVKSKYRHRSLFKAFTEPGSGVQGPRCRLFQPFRAAFQP